MKQYFTVFFIFACFAFHPKTTTGHFGDCETLDDCCPKLDDPCFMDCDIESKQCKMADFFADELGMYKKRFKY